MADVETLFMCNKFAEGPSPKTWKKIERYCKRGDINEKNLRQVRHFVVSYIASASPEQIRIVERKVGKDFCAILFDIDDRLESEFGANLGRN